MATMIKIHITHWMKDGTRVKPHTPGARKVRKKSKKWYGIGIPGYPTKKRVPLYESKKAALQELARLCELGELGAVGIHKPKQSHAKKTLGDHIDDFSQWLIDAHNTADYVRIATNRVRAVCDGKKWTKLADLDGSAAAAWLTIKREKVVKIVGGEEKIVSMSITTSNLYMDALSQFGRWLEEEKRIHRSPFDRMARGNEDTDRRRARRALSTEDFQKLLEAARTSTQRIYNLYGIDRYWLYRTAYYTAFRAAAMGSLTRESFDFDSEQPTVTLATIKNKSRKLKVNALPPEFAAELKKYVSQFAPGTPIWGRGCAMDHGADMIRVDLEAAGLPFKIAGPDGMLRFDFHAIRHTTATELTRYDLRTAQEILGHSKPSITAKYAHRDLSDQADAVGKMRG